MKTHYIIIEKLRQSLVPKGTLPLVRVKAELYYEEDFIKKCLEELEKLPLKITLGQEPTTLEKLAFHILMKTTNLDEYLDPLLKKYSPIYFT